MRTIYNSSPDIDIDEARAEFTENHDREPKDDNELFECLDEESEFYYYDEKANLDLRLPGKVLAIADLGFWDGRRPGYKVMGSNLNEVLHGFDCDDIHVYCDGYNVRSDACHHDGVHHITFRLVPDGIDAEKLIEAIYWGKHTPAMVRRYTRSLRPYVAEIYGW